jgi:hypothetical protein
MLFIIRLPRLIPYTDKIVGNQCVVNIRDQVLIRYSAFPSNWSKNGSPTGQDIRYLQNLGKPMTQLRAKHCTEFSLNLVYI